MNEGKVVLFDRPSRGGMARRGAPDKNGSTGPAAILLTCPTCACELHLEPDRPGSLAEVLCGRCNTVASARYGI